MDDFWRSLLVACIPAAASIITVLITNSKNNALQDERIKNISGGIKSLEEKVNQHNNFGLQIARLETRVEILERR